jgi:hypothetical protein
MGETTTINITPEANVETQEYRDSMVQKIDQANAVPQPVLQPEATEVETKQEKILGQLGNINLGGKTPEEEKELKETLANYAQLGKGGVVTIKGEENK